jgi:hypothetical protein
MQVHNIRFTGHGEGAAEELGRVAAGDPHAEALCEPYQTIRAW